MNRLVIARVTFTVRLDDRALVSGETSDAVKIIEDFLEETGVFQIHDATEVVSHGDTYLMGCKVISGGN